MEKIKNIFIKYKYTKYLAAILLIFFVMFSVYITTNEIQNNGNKVRFSNKTLKMELGTVQKVNVLFPKSVSSKEKEGTFISINDNVAWINQNGEIYAKEKGVTKIQFILTKEIKLDKIFSKDEEVKIIEMELEVVESDYYISSKSELYLNETTDAKFNTKNGKKIPNGQWKCGNDKLDIDKKTGKFTANKVGSSTILFEAGNGLVYFKNIYILQTPKEVEPYITAERSILKEKEKLQLEVIYPDGYTGERTGVWSTSFESIATVSDTGLVEAIKVGDVLIEYSIPNRKPIGISIYVVDKNGKGPNGENVGDPADGSPDNDGGNGGGNGDPNNNSDKPTTIIKPTINVVIKTNERIILYVDIEAAFENVSATNSNRKSVYAAVSDPNPDYYKKIVDILGLNAGIASFKIIGREDNKTIIQPINIQVTSAVYKPLSMVPPDFPIVKGSSGKILLDFDHSEIAVGTWKSSNPSVAKIDSTGELTIYGEKGSDCNITFESKKSGERVSILLVVE